MSIIKQTDNFNANFGEVLRSSAIFWIPDSQTTKTTISLANYWKFKNSLDVAIIVTWRSLSGKLLKRHKVEFLNVLNLICPFENFEGSCEIETFSLKNLRIPYSAIMAVYETQKSISMVHSYTRTYSHHEIEEERTITDGHESCWTIYSGNIESFAIGHNGNQAISQQLCTLYIRRYDDREISKKFTLKELNPYETFKIKPSEIIPNLEDFLDGKPGNARVDFNLMGAFTRLLCCNQLQDKSELQVTHSNFDYSQHSTDFVETDISQATAYMVIPPEISDTRFEVIVYPDRSPGEYLAGDKIMQPVEDILSFPVEGNSVIGFRRVDNKLPSRIVTALRLYSQSSKSSLLAECSLGVIHSKRPGKHFHWMLVSGLYETYILFTAITEIYSDVPSNLELCLTLYSQSQKEAISKKYGMEFFETIQSNPVSLKSIFEQCDRYLGRDFGYLSIWSSYPGFVIYSVLRKNNSVTIEHSF